MVLQAGEGLAAGSFEGGSDPTASLVGIDRGSILEWTTSMQAQIYVQIL